MEISPRMALLVPTFVADLRPAADAAAITRDPRPDLPLPIPPGQGQTAAAISASLVTAAEDAGPAAAARRVVAVDPPERTLKPWDTAMLPEASSAGPDRTGDDGKESEAADGMSDAARGAEPHDAGARPAATAAQADETRAGPDPVRRSETAGGQAGTDTAAEASPHATREDED